MVKFKDRSLAFFLDALSARKPTPGGGSAAALAAASGAALITMVANYSLGKGSPKTVETKLKDIRRKSESIRKKLLACVDKDIAAYERVVKARKGTDRQKAAALRQARKVPADVCALCYEAVSLTPFLVKKGNKYLLSDVEVAVELLLAAFRSAEINIAINQ